MHIAVEAWLVMRDCRSAGIHLGISEGKLTITGLPSILSIDLLARIKANKEGILSIISERERVLSEIGTLNVPSVDILTQQTSNREGA